MKKSRSILGLCVLIALSILSTLTAGCARPQGQNPGPSPGTGTVQQSLQPADFFPLKVGNTWNYEGQGNEYAAFSREVLFAEGNRAQVREDNGGTVMAVVYEVTADAVTRVFSKEEAYNNENFLKAPSTGKATVLKSPLKTGTTWEDAAGSREIVDTQATVTTPAGTFKDCIKVRSAGKESTVTEYYKKGVGLVKREFKAGNDTITSTLKEYALK